MENKPESAFEAYLDLIRREQETYLYQKALKKVQVITKSMSPEERKSYLEGDAFRNTLRQLQHRDPVWTGVCRGELIRSAHRDEFVRLEKNIERELADGRPVSLPFLRSILRCRRSLEDAREAVSLAEQGAARAFLRREEDRLLRSLEDQVIQGLKTRDMTALYQETGREKDLVTELMAAPFAHGLTTAAINLCLAPRSPGMALRLEVERALPLLSSCRQVCLPDGSTVASVTQKALHEEKVRLLARLRSRFPRDRIEILLRENPILRKKQRRIAEAQVRKQKLRNALLEAIPEHYRDLYPLAREMRRHFFLHLGPTNSGKTYEGIQRLHAAQNGIYLGPLRLLAAEQFEALNLDDVPCSLVTGEEQIQVPFSRVQSSTVEMADMNTVYDIAVIDECQMIADRDRGGAWSAAILGLQAREIHACASPDAEALLTRIIRDCGDELTIVRHERMTPLEIEKEGFQFPSSVRPGDALIVFSKARVHAVAAELKNRGHQVSLIYGALPPDVRRNQADRFMKGETDVVVSTDAIAMGMNLPIERVVFLESEKYDGDITRTLTDAEIKQIAGRAGRYGIYDVGYVNAFGFKPLIAQAMARPLLPLTEGVIRFPESLLGIPLPLSEIIAQWMNMQDKACFSKASTERMAALTAMMETRHTDKRLLYRFLCIPFDETDPDLLSLWKLMYHAEAQGEHIDPLAEKHRILIPEECTIGMLDSLEADYRRWDLYYNYTRLFLEEPLLILEEIQRRKDLISQGIVHILSTQKLPRKSCPSCKRPLPWNWPYRQCDSCHSRAHFPRRRH
ncbi:MAG: hypothetical protein IJI21_01330 [Clostridia bacterium]|nr:hypothetical protein [Clostridia bacterium]